MARINPSRRLPALALGVLACLAATLSLLPHPALADRLMVTRAQGEPLWHTAMPEGERWCVEWNHSVAHFTVRDCYRNVAGRMQLERSHQPDFAAGLGHTPGRGKQVSDGQGGYWIEQINEPVPDNRYPLRVGAMTVNHRLVWQQDDAMQTYSLSRHAAGERVWIQLVNTDEKR
ncbi:DUF1850 domain-containing protein [Halomonas alkaliantarctica]|nr:DUF1850 domain-containing protein [Halomonas alkaliantarctica]